MKLHLKKLAVLRQINHLLQMNIIAENGILHHKDLLSNGRQMNYKSKTSHIPLPVLTICGLEIKISYSITPFLL